MPSCYSCARNAIPRGKEARRIGGVCVCGGIQQQPKDKEKMSMERKTLTFFHAEKGLKGIISREHQSKTQLFLSEAAAGLK